MRRSVGAGATALVLAAALAVFGLAAAAPEATQAQDAPGEPKAAAGGVRLRAAVVELRAGDAPLPLLDAAELGDAADLEAFLEQLRQHGTVRALYLIDQQIHLDADSEVRARTRMPIITGRRATEDGGAVTAVSYEDFGATLSITAAGERQAPAVVLGDRRDVTPRPRTVTLELSMPAATAVDLGAGATAVAVDTLRTANVPLPRAGTPLVLILGCGGAGDADNAAPAPRVFLWRIVIG